MGEPVPMNLPAIRQILAMQLALRNGEPGAVQGKPVALDRINHKVRIPGKVTAGSGAR
jgi:hypothetical protein